MSHVNIKNLQCCMSLSLIFADVTCRIQEMIMPLVFIVVSPMHTLHVLEL